MQKIIKIFALTLILSTTACREISMQMGDNGTTDIVATVDNHTLLASDIKRDMPKELSGVDSATFAKMYIENWVLSQLKIVRANEVLSSHQANIERLVEDYRKSLIIRQLDQYYIDNAIDLEITDKQLAAYYRANSASFKLDHNKVRGVVVKAPSNFRNTATLNTALKGIAKRGSTEEVKALCEKHNLQLADLTAQWVSYSDFLSNLPTERSSNYNNLLSNKGVQKMTSGNMTFHFIIIDVAHKGDVAPLECVQEDIRRRLYAERRAEIVGKYEAELKHEAMQMGRVSIADSTLFKAMSYTPVEIQSTDSLIIDSEELIEEDIPSIEIKRDLE
ncbi:MAG: hypothetical protein J6U82_01415 [Alistipes sp.]|nr:hypothetical protein [Alistipes sp.]